MSNQLLDKCNELLEEVTKLINAETAQGTQRQSNTAASATSGCTRPVSGIRPITSTSTARSGLPSTTSLTRSCQPPTLSPSPSVIVQEQRRLFGFSQNSVNTNAPAARRRLGQTKTTKQQTWTRTFVCLADKTSSRIPTARLYITLKNASLGEKKLTFLVNDLPTSVDAKLKSAFPKLDDAGGYLLARATLTRDLEKVNPPYSVPRMKEAMPGHGKIFIIPLQKDLDIAPDDIRDDIDMETDALEECQLCRHLFYLHELNAHIKTCSEANNEQIPPQQTSTGNIPRDTSNRRQLPPQQTSTGNTPRDTSNLRQIPPQQTSTGNTPRDTSNLRQIPPQQTSTDNTPRDTSNLRQIPPQQTSTDNTPRDTSNRRQITPQQTNLRQIPPQQTSTDNTPRDTSNLQQNASDDRYARTLMAMRAISRPDGPDDAIDDIVARAVTYCKSNNLQDSPVEVLRHLQNVIVQGRSLEIVSSARPPTGCLTSQIFIDRCNVLDTGLSEVRAIENKRLTLQVEFYGEMAEDYGGPRKEFFSLILRAVDEFFFKNGLKEHLKTDYHTVGVIMALSMLQNGKMPCFLSEEQLQETFHAVQPNPCLLALREGLKELGIYQIAKEIPTLLHLLRKNTSHFLTIRQLQSMLKPEFSPDGSNSRRYEGDIYSDFIRYMREVAIWRMQNAE
ncbi:hypothetical protein AC249_AIPGENE7130 [Exaiptasia diaphana]|nr:hypothetical protein AC249_AIPGENE7130 [Exaiptasia diaphana]